MSHAISFDDGLAYEAYMGHWSRLAGGEFLHWLSPASGLDWLDVGCGNGAFTALLTECCAPHAVAGIDPSEAQLVHARCRPALAHARLLNGDAMDLPFPDNTFDAAVMPLVIFFVPDPDRGVSEMVRVVKPGGIVGAYGWDLTEGGFPYFPLIDELERLGIAAPKPPSPYAATLSELQRVWHGAGLTEVATTTITVTRQFESLDQLWSIVGTQSTVGRMLPHLTPDARQEFEHSVRARLPIDAAGGVTLTGRANAVRGRVAVG